MNRAPWFPPAVALLTAAFFLLTPAALFALPLPSFAISSGSTTGSYYAAASALAKIFNRKSVDYGARFATVASPGSVANIDAVAEGKAAFGIAETELLRQATQGIGPWQGKPKSGLRAVLRLFQESVTIVAAADSGITRMSDLKGKRLNIGARGSVEHVYAAALLQMSGLNPGQVVISEHPAALAPELLQKGEIDAYINIVGHPNLAVLEASTGKRKVLLVPMDQALIARVIKQNPLVAPTEVPTKFYPGLEFRGTVPTLGIWAVLFTADDQSEESVYGLVREILTNFDLFRRQHPILQNLAPRDTARVDVIPLHPGAVRYFKEAGLLP